MKTAEYPDVENLWFKHACTGSVSISGPLLKDGANDLAKQLGHENFRANTGWLARYKQRHGYQYKVICGEAHAAPTESIAEWKSGLHFTILSTYSPDDIFNCDETRLFFHIQLNRFYVGKGEDCHGGKNSKDRITIMPCANMLGTLSRHWEICHMLQGDPCRTH